MSVQFALADDGLAADGDYDALAMPEQGSGALRTLGLVAVCLGVAVLAGATFVLSYSPIRAVALQAGITPHLARGYPLLLDAMLVIVLAAVLALRGAGVPSRLLAWLTLLLVLAAAAGADALHAAGHRLPRQPAAITAAILPWVLVLFAFVLMLAMLRHARLRRTSGHSMVAGPVAAGRTTPAVYGPPTLELPSRASVPSVPAQPAAADGEPATELADEPAAAEYSAGVATDEDVSPDDTGTDEPTSSEATGHEPKSGEASGHDPSSDEATEDEATSAEATSGEATGEASDPADGTAPYPADSLSPERCEAVGERGPDPNDTDGTDDSADAGGSSDVAETTAGQLSAGSPDGPDDGDMPVFHRMFSAPVPPSGE
jgi:Protein of unknown function (DUF2637)